MNDITSLAHARLDWDAAARTLKAARDAYKVTERALDAEILKAKEAKNHE